MNNCSLVQKCRMEYQRQNTYDRILEKEAPMKILDYAFSEAAYYRKNLSQFQSKEHDDGICRTLPELPMLNIESVIVSSAIAQVIT